MNVDKLRQRRLGELLGLARLPDIGAESREERSPPFGPPQQGSVSSGDLTASHAVRPRLAIVTSRIRE